MLIFALGTSAIVGVYLNIQHSDANNSNPNNVDDKGKNDNENSNSKSNNASENSNITITSPLSKWSNIYPSVQLLDSTFHPISVINWGNNLEVGKTYTFTLIVMSNFQSLNKNGTLRICWYCNESFVSCVDSSGVLWSNWVGSASWGVNGNIVSRPIGQYGDYIAMHFSLTVANAKVTSVPIEIIASGVGLQYVPIPGSHYPGYINDKAVPVPK